MGFKQEAKKDCFAYHNINGREKCTALKMLYCRFGKCKFYKTQKEMCDGCKRAGQYISCEKCREIRRC